ncbi:MAG: DUF4325 domain-containing protein [Patescibacteria group bacterium]|nr:DUF4325 domain-containing protein [Patescibacteria group bacterium]MBU1876885.1 DUF4325 domain-containing protein [Patescibacteria group bacterium]
MNIKNIILKKITKQGKISISDIKKETGFSSTYINRFLKELKDGGKIILIGKSNRAHYVLAESKNINPSKAILNSHYILTNKNLQEDEIFNKIKKDTGIILDLPKNIVSIIEYAFTEILNNAIDHSKSKKIDVVADRGDDFIRFNISDKGIGIFNSIIKKYNLKNELEAIQELTKGKLTTAPERHTGEGIFFTSRAVDKLIIQSSSKKLIFDNMLNDIFIKDAKKLKGTRVIFYIGVKSKHKLENIFREYSDENFKFNKTKVIVKLYKIDTNYISRSQARRILMSLEKFKTIVLDFSKVDMVGQAFVDEVFRIWKKNHLNTKIQYQNANENIIFMIKRVGAEILS